MNPGPKAARELMAFYLDAGVDTVLGDEPVNRMTNDLPAQRPGAAAPPRDDKIARGLRGEPSAKSNALAPRPQAAAAPVSPEAAVMAAREAARTAQSLPELQALAPHGGLIASAVSLDCFLVSLEEHRLSFVRRTPQRRGKFTGRQ